MNVTILHLSRGWKSKGKLFQKKFDALGKAHTTRYVSQSLREGKLVDSHQLGKPLTNQFPSCQLFRYAMRYKQLLVSSASQQPPTTRQSVTTWWHGVITVWQNTTGCFPHQTSRDRSVIPKEDHHFYGVLPWSLPWFLPWSLPWFLRWSLPCFIYVFYMFYHGFYHVLRFPSLV